MTWFRFQRDELESRIGYRFRDPDTLAAAFVHRSWAHEEGLADHNERLEFLGDAVLGLVAADWLYRRFPEQPEGELARMKAWLVSAPNLAWHAGELGLGERMKLGVGEERSGGRSKPSILADALEAVFGAVWLDGGFDAARTVVSGFLEAAEGAGEADASDPKTALQEVVQGRGWELPAYSIVEESGPDHEKSFVCEVLVRGEPAGRGSGRSKKEAQQRAAADALARFAAAEPRNPATKQDQDSSVQDQDSKTP